MFTYQQNNSIYVGGSYGGYSSSFSVDLSKVNENELKTPSEDEVSETIRLGSKSHPEPIHLVLAPLYRNIENADYVSAQNCSNWEQIRANLKTAMFDYPLYKRSTEKLYGE